MSAELATVLGTILVIAVGLMRQHHTDSMKTRDLIEKNRDLIEEKSKESQDLIKEKSKENREMVKENRDLIKENRDLIEKYHWETAASIGEVRERLARIEGRLEIGPPPPPDDTTAEAA
jgi:gas vesicle protein